jgi:parallel beta-helix repeat protein
MAVKRIGAREGAVGVAIVAGALVALAVIAGAMAILTGGSSPSTPARATATAPRWPAGSPRSAPPAPRPNAVDGPGPTVAYTGPRRLSGLTTLRARAAGGGVVAVTFMLDRRPLGTDTTAPYRLDIDAGAVRRGTHRLTVAAVDRLGRRSRSRRVQVSADGQPTPALTATPDSGLDDALAALRRGNMTVRLGPGRYVVSDAVLASGARLVGAGASTVLMPPGDADDWAVLTVRGSGVRISDLVVDGRRHAARGIAVADGSNDVRLQRLRIAGMTQNGVEAWGAHHGLSVQDSNVIGGRRANAGVFDLGSDASSDTSVIRTRVADFRGFGVLLAQTAHGRPNAARGGVALDNVVSDIVNRRIQDGTSEGGIWSGGVKAAIVGNTIRRTGVDGIETVGSSTRTAVTANDIADTPVGIYLEHATNRSLIAGNRIARVSTGINVEWRHGGAGSAENTFAGNVVRRARAAGLFLDVGSDGNRIVDNVFRGGRRPIVLQGASANLLAGNRASGRGRLVDLRTAHYDDGELAVAAANRIVDRRHPGVYGAG